VPQADIERHIHYWAQKISSERVPTDGARLRFFMQMRDLWISKAEKRAEPSAKRQSHQQASRNIDTT